MTKKDHSANRVFLMGAGASKACGLPLTNELLPTVLPSLKTKSLRKRVTEFAKYLYPYFKSSWGNYPNLEELLSLMDVYVEFSSKIKSSHKFEPDEVEQLKNDLLGAITASLSDLTEKINIERTQFFHLGKILRPGDAVVTFNWDLLVEKALTEIGQDWNYELKEGAISLLKPHGSIDWFDADSASIKKRLTSAVIEDIGKLRVFRKFRMPRLASPITPIIVPPLVNKKWKYLEFNRIWRSTWRALRTANEIHVIGFSLPPEDLHVRFVIRSAVRINEQTRSGPLIVTVVNPDKEVYLRFGRLVETPVRYFETSFARVALTELSHNSA